MLAPARPSRTQAQRRDEMRRVLLDAAVDSLVEHGFAGTTTLEVQRRAGVSRGALLHHFPSKAELLVATIGHLVDMRARELKVRGADLPAGPARIDAVLDLLWECFRGSLFQVALELRTAARTDPELRRALTVAERGMRDGILHQTRALMGKTVAARPGFDQAIDLTLHLMMGAAATALLHGEEARTGALIARWKTLFPALLSGSPDSPLMPDSPDVPPTRSPDTGSQHSPPTRSP